MEVCNDSLNLHSTLSEFPPVSVVPVNWAVLEKANCFFAMVASWEVPDLMFCEGQSPCFLDGRYRPYVHPANCGFKDYLGQTILISAGTITFWGNFKLNLIAVEYSNILNNQK